jgi:RHS repeat-associated protein
MRNKVGIIEISSYDYSVNAIGLRTSVATSGTAFSGASGWSWAYDSLGQVTLAEHGTNSNFHRSYAYDAIGNRQRAADGTLDVNDTSAAVYTANALNQYSSINDPQSSIINPVHDADGNMTSGPLPVDPASASSLTWDAENRLISATVDTTTVTYTYDAQSRRIATKVGSNTTLFVYDGWNPIAEWSADLQSASLTKTFTWGMDLSGSSQGAGGVGGLLAVAIHDQQSSIYYPTYDGNGNVSEYLDATGAIVAHYEYDPFGRIVVESGSQAADFAHRFSTKPVDSVTGLLYYGYRWYDPVTGRWPSRDPIEEEGGINLYGFAWNNGINAIDYLGLTTDGNIGGNEHRDVKDIQSEIDKLRKEQACECDRKKKIELQKRIERLQRAKREASRTQGKKGQHGSDKNRNKPKGWTPPGMRPPTSPTNPDLKMRPAGRAGWLVFLDFYLDMRRQPKRIEEERLEQNSKDSKLGQYCPTV